MGRSILSDKHSELAAAALDLGPRGRFALRREPQAPMAPPVANWAGQELPVGDGDPWQNWVSPTNRLVRRVTQGITASEAGKAASLGYDAYLESQLNIAAIDDSAVNAEVAQRYPRTTWTVQQLFGLQDDFETMVQLIQATVYRSIKSKRQLEARMFEFWADHFNVWIFKGTGALMVPFVNMLRENALTTFPNILRKVIGDPAMLTYLDNVANYGYYPNINFAREILELHTVGVDAGYVTLDIKQLARALTGWSMDYGETSTLSRGKFRYRSNYHWYSNKWVFGHYIPAGQQDEGESVIAYLAMHPKTARHLATKLVRYFVSHEPAPNMVDQVTQVYLASGGDVKSVLREVLKQANIATAPAKLKRPGHLAGSALRGTSATVTDLATLAFGHVYQMGHLPFLWEPPDGYPDRIDFWSKSMLPRLQFAYSLSNNEIPGVAYTPLGAQQGFNIGGLVTQINNSLFGGEMSNRDKNSIVAYLTRGGLDPQKVRGAYAIALASPSFQWY